MVVLAAVTGCSMARLLLTPLGAAEPTMRSSTYPASKLSCTVRLTICKEQADRANNVTNTPGAPVCNCLA